MRRIGIACIVLLVVSSAPASAQVDDRRFQLGVQFVHVTSGEFDSNDVGLSARVSWNPARILGVEGELGVYPSDFADEPAFSSGRVEGLFGVTVGPALGRWRPFAKLRSGFVNLREAPEPFACILIFPPPLRCQLAAGDTVFALDTGGGLELFPSGRTFIRVDLSDRAVRFPAPVLDTNGRVRDESFFSHDIRFSVGGGVRF